MFIKGDMFEKLLCCRRKVVDDDDDDDDRVVEEVVLQHTNNNKTEYISSAQLVEKLKGGTTAVVALVREKRLVVAWLGDSQALLVRRRSPVKMVEPHKPDLPVERERVEDMGGCVINIQGTWRVLGQLAVSRAIGDCEYKPYVSSECDIKSLEIEGDEDFLILACDGLWDTLTPEAAVNVVYAYLTHNHGDTDGVGRCLVEAARNTGSEDNITAVVVFLRPVTTLMEEEAQRIAQGQVPEPVPQSVLCKDDTPSSINAIFSPPVGQFEYASPNIPTYNPFETPTPPTAATANMDSEQAATPAYEQYGGDEPMEASEAPTMPDYYRADQEASKPYDPCSAPTPTAEEVDAALAVLEELDNIPDGVCESGEVEEEEEEEEEWSYYRMEPQTHPQGEDVLVGGGAGGANVNTDQVKEADSFPADQPHHDNLIQQEEHQEAHTKLSQESFREDFFTKEDKDISGEAKVLDLEYQPLKEEMDPFHHDVHVPMEADQPPLLDHVPDIMQASMENIPEPEISSGKMLNFEPDFLENPAEPSSPHTTGSPQMPGSPRSVEGFITSVELNTPDEGMGANFNMTPAQDLNGSGIDKSSGPFSVYVSSSPEPLSMEPSFLPPVDLNVTEVSNGHAEEEGHFSPVEIVHAQSTVEVLAPPSPGENQEMEFVVPDQTADIMTTSQILLDEPSDITFIPEPAIEPVAEIPVPVYLEGTTPVSEGDLEEQSNESLPAKENVPESERDLVSLDTKMAMSPPPAAFESEPIKEEPQETKAPFQEEMEIVPPINNGMDATPAPVQEETVPSIVKEVVERQEVEAPVVEETVLLVNTSEVVKNEVVDVILTPEITPVVPEVTPVVPEKKTEAKPEVKSPTKTAKTPAKSSPDKAGKTTPAQDTARRLPASKTTARTPLSKSAEKKTPVAKTDARPSPIKNAPGVARTMSKPSASTRPTTTKPTTTKPAAPKPAAARPAPRTTTGKAPTPTQPSTKPTERKVPKPGTPTVPRASLNKPSTATTKSTTTRPTPATRTAPTTTTRRPGTAPAKPTDKADSSKVNGTARPSTRPTTTPRTTGASTTATTTARKPLSTRPAAKTTAEKDTKNTTNRILSTTNRPAPKSTTMMGTTRTVGSKTSTMSARSAESKTTSRLNGTATTTTTTTKARITSKSTAAKATDVGAKKGVGSRLKAAPGTKTSPAKAAPVIEAAAAVVNGENKIAHEETSVEVVEKCAVEDTMTEKILTEAMTTQVITTTETTEVIVNGDH